MAYCGDCGARLRAVWRRARPAADPIAAEVTASGDGGHGRLVFKLGEDIDSVVKQSGNVLIITFKQPIAVKLDRLATQLPDYIGAARRDPDGKAIRIALAQKATVNSIHAAEQLFVDILPESWSGEPPGLPPEVIADLAKRAHEAERLQRQQQQFAKQRKIAPVRVRIATQPTFTRYVFDVPDQVAVVGRSRQGTPDADVRCADQVRSRRRQGGAAGSGRCARRGNRPGNGAGAFQLSGQSGCPHLSRRHGLRRRRRRHECEAKGGWDRGRRAESRNRSGAGRRGAAKSRGARDPAGKAERRRACRSRPQRRRQSPRRSRSPRRPP